MITLLMPSTVLSKVYLTHDGVTMDVTEWAHVTMKKRDDILQDIFKKGMTVAQALGFDPLGKAVETIVAEVKKRMDEGRTPVPQIQIMGGSWSLNPPERKDEFTAKGRKFKQLHLPLDERDKRYNAKRKAEAAKERESELEYLKRVYDVSKDGVVTRKSDGFVFKHTIYHGGERVKLPVTVLCKRKRKCVYKTYHVHRLVMMIHNPNFTDDCVVYHRNGNKRDNRLQNLCIKASKPKTVHYGSCAPRKEYKCQKVVHLPSDCLPPNA